MIKVYMDWNVMSQMKNGLHPDLLKIISDRERFFNVFSTSHIGDIYESFNNDESRIAMITEDLNFISTLTNDWCAYNNGKDVVIEQYEPHTLFEQRKRETNLFKNFSFDNLLSDLGGDDQALIDLTKSFTNLLKALPIDNVFKNAYQDPLTREQMNLFLPGLEDNLTFEGLINAMMLMFRRLNEQGDYKELRDIVQSGLNINRDKIFNNDNPYKLIEQAYKKIGALPPQHADAHKYAPIWFNEITDSYIALDMHGYQEDKVNVGKGRKETFRNTTEDAFHSAYASMCDFYITNDNKSYKKSLEVYKKLNLNTIVLKPTEFLEYYNEYLSYHSQTDDVQMFINILTEGQFEVSEDDNYQMRSYYFPFFLFNHFTRAHVHTDKVSQHTSIFLSKDNPTNCKWTFRVEFENIIKLLASLFGEDIREFGLLKDDERLNDDWLGREWKYGDWVFRLTWRNGWLQLYLDL